MGWSDSLFGALEFAMRECALFAACGFLLLGASDLLVDLIWFGRALVRRLATHSPPITAASLAPAERPGPLAIFVPAWDEGQVIGRMLAHALSTFDHPDYRLYLGCYPNDPATIAAVRATADERLRLVIGPAPGPTTKADCLNRLWEAMAADEAANGRRFKAVVLHDAEDVVHSAELRIFDRLIERFDLVQLPVLPLIDRGSRWIGGHYADEFAEAHGKELVVREALGASLPSAGVGCAFCREALGRLGGEAAPFDADSLTEDYELGLRLRAAGGRAAFVRMAAGPDKAIVSTREYFPGTIEGAVQQKARWMTGIALSGWERLGWSGGVAERWMRLRDRQSLLAALFLATGYIALGLEVLLELRRFATGAAPRPLGPVLLLLLQVNVGMLLWRLAMRCGFTTRAYGWREGLRAIPRAVVSNWIAILAARRAVLRYLVIRRSGRTSWDKTVHAFPHQLPAE